MRQSSHLTLNTNIVDLLTTIFKDSKEFKVIQSNKGEQNGNYVTKLQCNDSVDIAGLKVKKSITLYVSLIEEAEVNKAVNIDPEHWNVFYSDFTPEDTGEVIELKWITPNS